MKKTDTKELFTECCPLFFETRQIIRQNLRGDKPDPNVWLRLETLRFIEEAGEPTMHDIARRLRIAAPSATSLIEHLSKKRWITRHKNPGDKRVVRITLTVAGKKTLAGYRERSTTTMRRVFSKLPERDVTELIRILRNVSEAHRP